MLCKGIFQLATETASISFPVGTKFKIQPLPHGPVLEANLTGDSKRPFELRALDCTGEGRSLNRGRRSVIQGYLLLTLIKVSLFIFIIMFT